MVSLNEGLKISHLIKVTESGHLKYDWVERLTFIVQLDTSRDPLDWWSTKTLKDRQELHMFVRL
jgi:hypothetical protein